MEAALQSRLAAESQNEFAFGLGILPRGRKKNGMNRGVETRSERIQDRPDASLSVCA